MVGVVCSLFSTTVVIAKLHFSGFLLIVPYQPSLVAGKFYALHMLPCVTVWFYDVDRLLFATRYSCLLYLTHLKPFKLYISLRIEKMKFTENSVFMYHFSSVLMYFLILIESSRSDCPFPCPLRTL